MHVVTLTEPVVGNGEAHPHPLCSGSTTTNTAAKPALRLVSAARRGTYADHGTRGWPLLPS